MRPLLHALPTGFTLDTVTTTAHPKERPVHTFIDRYRDRRAARRLRRLQRMMIACVHYAEKDGVTPTRSRIVAAFGEQWSPQLLDAVLDTLVDRGLLECMYTDAGSIYATTATSFRGVVDQ